MRHFSRPGKLQAGFIISFASTGHFAMNIRTSKSIVIGALLAATGAAAYAQDIVLRCGAQGQHMTETQGYYINSAGEVVFSEDSVHCGPGGGTPLPVPAALSAQFTQPPSPSQITSLPETVSFAAQVHNFDHQSSFFNDSCTVVARNSSNVTVASTGITPPTGGGDSSGTLTFPSGLADGPYSVGLACSRSFQDGQNVAVSNPPAQTITVAVGGGTAPPIGCEGQQIPSVFDPVTHFAYTGAHTGSTHAGGGGWGRDPHQGSPWRAWPLTLTTNGQNVVQKMQLRSWNFVATDNTMMILLHSSGSLATSGVSISECPGDFDTPQAACTQNGSVTWATGNKIPANSGDACVLEAGKTYYLNIAPFDAVHHRNTGQYVSTNTCTNCTTRYQATTQ